MLDKILYLFELVTGLGFDRFNNSPVLVSLQPLKTAVVLALISFILLGVWLYL